MDIKKNIEEILSNILEISSGDLPKNAAPGDPEKWDSLKHLQLLIALEEDFEFVFSDIEMNEMDDLPNIIRIIENKMLEQK